MSEFTCADCGDPMLHGKCTSCSGTRVGRMDGKSEAELHDEVDWGAELAAMYTAICDFGLNDEDYHEAEDMRMEMRGDEWEEDDEEWGD